MADKELTNETTAIEKGSNKKKNLSKLEFLNFTSTSIKTMIDNINIEKYKLEKTDIVMCS
jgi:hypothetical protein